MAGMHKLHCHKQSLVQDLSMAQRLSVRTDAGGKTMIKINGIAKQSHSLSWVDNVNLS